MTIQIKHAFTSAKGDGTDATLVRPSNWNAVHTATMATGQLLGRLTAGTGAFEELPISAFIASILNVADAPALLAALGIGAFKTGDVKASINTTADAGWIVYPGTGSIGDASSAAGTRANADCSALFQLLWNNISDTFCPVSSGRGGSAAADFAAHKNITLPWFSGRSIIGAGSGGSLTTRTLGQYFGTEGETLTSAQIPAHTHPNSLTDPGHVHSSASFFTQAGPGVGGGGAFGTNLSASTNSSTTGITITNAANTGGGGSHNNMQPSIPMWIHLKL